MITVKNINKKMATIGACGLLSLLFVSCADYFDRHFETGRTDRIADYGYLEDYGPLKTYVNRSSFPNFKLGVGTTVSEYLKGEVVYELTNSNFDETVAGNAMKMASCVKDDGSMDFSTVSDYVNTATNAGLSVYGHTLAWHSQQPVKWLNSLIADHPIEVDPSGMKEVEDYYQDLTEFSSFPYYVMGYTPEFSSDEGLISEYPGSWYQYFIATSIPCDPDKNYTYTMTCEIKSEGGGAIPCQFRWSWSEDPVAASLVIDEGDWTEYSCTFSGIKGSTFDIIFQPGTFESRFCVRNIRVTHSEAAGGATYMESLINNGDMEGDDAQNFAKKENAGQIVYEISNGVGVDGSRGVSIASNGGQPDAWESQFWIVADKALHEGDKVHMKFDYRADGGCAGTSVSIQSHMNPGDYIFYDCGLGNVSFTSNWQTFDKTITVNSSMVRNGDMQSFAFNMSPNSEDGVYYIDNVVLEIEKQGDGIPQTPEEKKENLTNAMEQWISGMMEACEGKVKAWDVVNEAVSGGNADNEGVYALQHGSEGNTTDFFWQDYLGDLDYVRTAVKFARQYGPEDIKLFVNDYNLESDWDQNNKLKSLIKWIERWEADGVTKIDGIGTQMHITCYMNPSTQESKKAAIEQMFKLMAATGKLVRVSELDMGLQDEAGNTVMTENVTEAQHHAMADLYKFVVEKYLEIIPASQQWGICQWAPTDSPAGSGWRAGEPLGLWDLDYYRKHTYAGFADGLQGK